MSEARVIAAYLPQFHPIPENDEWWGTGFTEWTNVRRARPLFQGHDQPRVPADLGYYDLGQPEVREAQADLARAYGIEGFCYWHYWLGNGRRLLERPFNDVLMSGTPAFPFCLAWANHSWKDKTFDARGTDSVLIEQRYPGRLDWIAHFKRLLPAFKDKRYITIDDRPLVYIYGPGFIPHLVDFIQLWRRLALENGLHGLHFVAQTYDPSKVDLYMAQGFDAVNVNRLFAFAGEQGARWQIADYELASSHFHGLEDRREDVYPCIFPNWDPSPRRGLDCHILVNSSPAAFKVHATRALEAVKDKHPEHRVIFLKSWNEWAEGNYIEPDSRFGHGYLEALKESLGDAENGSLA